MSQLASWRNVIVSEITVQPTATSLRNMILNQQESKARANTLSE